jgi:hypothetical protein
VAGGSNTTKVVYFPMALITSRGPYLEQEHGMTLLSASRSVMNSSDPTPAVSSTCGLPSPTSQKRTSSTASTTASLTQVYIVTLGVTGQRQLQDYAT